jgi:hypothetical protein
MEVRGAVSAEEAVVWVDVVLDSKRPGARCGEREEAPFLSKGMFVVARVL